MKIGFFPLMFLILMTLKLCGVIKCSWLIVTAPLWFGFPLVFLFFVAVAVIAAILK